ncbi:hypothetical protein PF003_g23697 [Phytophthora fragariae]|nr:hypothetical protein PF003_g23697 [Phytophthora fragariae]
MSCAALALSSSMGLVDADELCSVVPYTYGGAMSSYPQLSTALSTLENYAIASWFTDRITSQDRANLMSRMLSQCPDESRLSIVVYGIPNKDCSGGFSSSGSVTSSAAYQAFLKELTDAVGDHKVLYVVEPDAVGLLAKDGGCGGPAGYLENLKIAANALSVNTNAQLYLDVGYWMLADATSASKVATVMQEIGSAGRVKGVTINTSNFRSNEECAGYCSTFQAAMGSDDMHCIVDTSRNYNGSPTTDWCNIPTAGIGKPPTSNTGFANLDYFMWIKPPGESDGYCWGGVGYAKDRRDRGTYISSDIRTNFSTNLSTNFSTNLSTNFSTDVCTYIGSDCGSGSSTDAGANIRAGDLHARHHRPNHGTSACRAKKRMRS